MTAYTKERLERLLKIEFIRFCIVGGTGFVINLIILVFLRNVLNVPVFWAQAIGAEIALFSNFTLHNKWTYKSHRVNKSFGKLLLQFHSTTWPAILGSALMVSLGESTLHLSNAAALGISSIVALLWNFMWSKFIIWRDVKPNQVEEIA